MKLITSRDNALYKDLKHLATSAQARRKASTTLLDGVHLCQAYLAHRGQPVWCVVNQTSLDNAEVAQLANACDHQLVMPDALYQSLSQVDHGVGIFFVVDIPKVSMPARLDEGTVLLENLQDPGNLGSILRSAAAAGIKRVVTGAETVSAWSPKVLRAGMGAHFVVDIVEHVDLTALLSSTALPVLATSSHATETIFSCDLRQDVIWLFGNEGQGLSDALMACATQRVAIPHLGAMESLNVAACAAVCFFEQLRQRQG